MRLVPLSILTFFFMTAAHVAVAAGDDTPTVDALKIEANHNLMRLKAYRSEVRDNRIYETEREKGLAEHLEEQERWDMLRERGLRDYRREKLADASPEEGGPEYREYLKEKQASARVYERSRENYVSARNRILAGSRSLISKLEEQEYDLDAGRPRYDIRKRSRNKWVSSGSGRGGGSSSAGMSGGGYVPPPAPDMQEPAQPVADFPPLPDFPPAPAPYEGYEDMPVPPPVYDGTAGGVPFDQNYAPEVAIPPPPPPPPDFDF